MAQEAAFPTKEIRQKCWQARDSLWKCLDDNNDSEKVCSNFQKQLEASCPQQWVDHYARRRKYLKFKSKIESGTYDPVEELGK